MFRQSVVQFVADFLRVNVLISDDEEQKKQPKNKDYRLTRQVWFDGTVHWKIEQFISQLETLRTLFPHYPTDKLPHVNGKPDPYNWIPIPQDFGSEEEALEYLNESLRSCEVMEATHYYVD